MVMVTVVVVVGGVTCMKNRHYIIFLMLHKEQLFGSVG